jgi:hypothetical protein
MPFAMPLYGTDMPPDVRDHRHRCLQPWCTMGKTIAHHRLGIDGHA